MRMIALAAALMASAPAMAQTYVTGGGGLVVPNDPQVQMKTNNLTVDLDDGFTGVAAVGYDFGPIRTEVEAAYAQASVARIYDAKRSFNYTQGTQSRRSVMANAYLDMPVSDAVTAYVGGGAGISWMQMRAAGGEPCKEVISVRIVNDDPNTRTGPSGTCKDQGDSTETGFTYQAMAGFEGKLAPGLYVGPQFRFVSVEGVHTAAKSAPTRETKFTTDKSYKSLNALVTARVTF